MAYAFLKGLGLKGDIGTFTVDLKKNKMKVSPGHKLVSAKDGEFVITSSRYPFCACLPAGKPPPPTRSAKRMTPRRTTASVPP